MAAKLPANVRSRKSDDAADPELIAFLKQIEDEGARKRAALLREWLRHRDESLRTEGQE